MCDGTENGGEGSLIKIRGTELYRMSGDAVESARCRRVAYDVAALHSGNAALGRTTPGASWNDNSITRPRRSSAARRDPRNIVG